MLSFFPDANACPVAGLAVRSDNRYLAAGGPGLLLPRTSPGYLWPCSCSESLPPGGDPQHPMDLHLAQPPQRMWLPCRPAGCFDATVRISDLRTYRVCGALEGHTDRVTRLAGEGDFILSGSFDGNCRLWSFLP